jgi:hypothetical protein
VRPEGRLLPDRLRSLLCQVRDTVAQGVRQEATSELASVWVCSSWDLTRLEPGFPMAIGPQERRMLVNVFVGADAVITVEVDVDDILTRGANPGQDSI